jgi:hypothetical protein
MSTTARLARWWEVPEDQQRQGNQGRLALAQGSHVGITCPKCGAAPVVYNGNYFCDNYPPLPGEEDLRNGTCDWALAHPAKSKRDRAVCDLIGIDYF